MGREVGVVKRGWGGGGGGSWAGLKEGGGVGLCGQRGAGWCTRSYSAILRGCAAGGTEWVCVTGRGDDGRWGVLVGGGGGGGGCARRRDGWPRRRARARGGGGGRRDGGRNGGERRRGTVLQHTWPFAPGDAERVLYCTCTVPLCTAEALRAGPRGPGGKQCGRAATGTYHAVRGRTPACPSAPWAARRAPGSAPRPRLLKVRTIPASPRAPPRDTYCARHGTAHATTPTPPRRWPPA